LTISSSFVLISFCFCSVTEVPSVISRMKRGIPFKSNWFIFKENTAFYTTKRTHTKRERKKYKRGNKGKRSTNSSTFLILELLDHNKEDDIIIFYINCAIDRKRKERKDNMRISMILIDEEKEWRHVYKTNIHSSKTRRREEKNKANTCILLECSLTLSPCPLKSSVARFTIFLHIQQQKAKQHKRNKKKKRKIFLIR
jgi:hypothetical protein